MRKLIVGCGYLGMRVAREWLSAGHEVIALTRSQQRAKELQELGLATVVGDVTEAKTLKALPEADVLLYAVGYDRRSRKERREVSVLGLENVLRELAGRVQRCAFISSTSVYGQSQAEWVDESSECQPTRENGRICLEAEAAVQNVASQMECTILRLAGIYGPGRLLARVELLRSGEAVPGSPDAYLNLIHVDDAVAAVLASETRAAPSTTYLVCDDRPVTRREYFTQLASLVNAPAPTFDETVRTERQPAGINKRCSNRRLRDELGLKLLYPTIETGLPQAVSAGG